MLLRHLSNVIFLTWITTFISPCGLQQWGKFFHYSTSFKSPDINTCGSIETKKINELIYENVSICVFHLSFYLTNPYNISFFKTHTCFVNVILHVLLYCKRKGDPITLTKIDLERFIFLKYLQNIY